MTSNGQPEGRLSTAAILLGLALLWFVLVGGTHFGSHHTPIRAINSAVGTIVVGCWLWSMPRRADRTDILLLGALVAFLLACVVSNFPRLSYEAATTAMAYTAAASLARWELADRRSARALITLLGFCSLGLLLIFVPLWMSVWSGWVSVGTIPPLDLRLPVGPFRHWHAVAMLFALLLPALLQLTKRRLVRVVAYLGIGMSLLVIVGAGSRTVWLGLTLAMLIPLAATNGRPSGKAVRVAGIAIGIVAVLGAAGVLSSFIGRLTTASTIALRFEIWGASLDRWLLDPIFGTGPGSFSTAFTLGDYFQRYVSVGRHPDNAFVQLLMEAGVLGVVSLGLVISALIVGFRNSNGRWTRPALIGVAMFAFLSVTNDPASAGYYLIPIGISWAALCTPSLAPRVVRDWSASWRTALIGLSALLLVGSTSALLLGSAAFDESQHRVKTGESASAIHSLDAAIALDPGFGMYWRERGLLSANSDPSAAIADLRVAIAKSPADTTAMRALAILTLREGNAVEALEAAQRAAELRPTDSKNLTTLALVASMTDNKEMAREALVKLLQRAPRMPASPNWAQHFPGGQELRELLAAADDAWDDQVDVTRDSAMSQVWLNAVVGGDLTALLERREWDELPFMRPLHALLQCDAMEAKAISEQQHAARVTHPAVAIMVARWLDPLDPVEDELALAGVGIGRLAVSQPAPSSVVWDPGEDNRIYERDPVSPTQLGLDLPTDAEGLSAWLMDPRAAAEIGAPGSGLAECDP